MDAMEKNSARPNLTWIVIAASLVIIAITVVGVFWWSSKEFGEKSVEHIQNMQKTAEKASDLQKKINKQIKEQEDFLNNLK